MVTLGDAHTLKPVTDREAPSLHPTFFQARALGHHLAKMPEGRGMTAGLQQVGTGVGGACGAQLCDMFRWLCPVLPGGRPPAVLQDPNRVCHVPPAQEGTTPSAAVPQNLSPDAAQPPALTANLRNTEHRATC